MESFVRTELLIGEKNMEILRRSRVAVFGIGGVGSFACEGLVRAGIGRFDLIDDDIVSVSNLNRQLIATTETLRQRKVEVMKARILSVNPEAEVNVYPIFVNEETISSFDFSRYDYVVDAIDTLSAKLLLVEKCRECGVPIISSMGTGNKLDPTRFRVADIFSTSVCPLARRMRSALRKRKIDSLKVIYSEEEPLSPKKELRDERNPKRIVPASVSFVPSVAGLILSGEVVKDLIGKEERR